MWILPESWPLWHEDYGLLISEVIINQPIQNDNLFLISKLQYYIWSFPVKISLEESQTQIIGELLDKRIDGLLWQFFYNLGLSFLPDVFQFKNDKRVPKASCDANCDLF